MHLRHLLPAFLALLLLGTGLAIAEQPAPRFPAEFKAQLAATLEDCAAKQRAGAVTRWPRPGVMANADNYYPSAMQSQGYQAIVLLEMLIDSAGNPRFVHSARAVSNHENAVFADGAARFVRDSTWIPAQFNGVPVSRWAQMKMKFIIGPGNSMGNILDERKLHDLQRKAANGDLKSIEEVSYLHSIASSEVALTTAEEFDYLAVSAQNGEAAAALRVAQLLSAPVCVKPPPVQQMLTMQAMRGYSAAEMVLAGQLMEADEPATYAQIAPLLHGAANSVDPFVALWATGLLATAPADALRDPAAALSHAGQFKGTDPDTLETLAAIQAANGNFEQAVKIEQQAIAVALKLKWKVDEQQKRLATYQAGKSWTGYLCDCRQLVPGEGV